MIVLDQDIFAIVPTQIGSTRVLQTWVGGKVVYDAAEDPFGEEAIEDEFGVDLDFEEGAGHGMYQWQDHLVPGSPCESSRKKALRAVNGSTVRNLSSSSVFRQRHR
jgi:hypothetical protein